MTGRGLLALLVWLAAQHPRAAPACGPHCGTERWLVKTLSDRDTASIDPVAVRTTVVWLRAQPAPRVLPAAHRASAVERTLYTVPVWVHGWNVEGDSDYHLVISDPHAAPGQTMIAEVPSPHCAVVCSNPHAAEWAQARLAIVRALGPPPRRYRRLPQPRAATVTGVGFFDVLHGQQGVAPNGVELHPLLTVEFYQMRGGP